MDNPHHMADFERGVTRRARIEWLSLFNDSDDAGAGARSGNAGAGNGGGAGADAGAGNAGAPNGGVGAGVGAGDAEASDGDASNGGARAWTHWSSMSDRLKGLLIAGFSTVLVMSLA